jgi:hypothetical protein
MMFKQSGDLTKPRYLTILSCYQKVNTSQENLEITLTNVKVFQKVDFGLDIQCQVPSLPTESLPYLDHPQLALWEVS